MAAPGITDAQKKALADAVDKMVKSTAWKEVLKQKGWDDAYLPGDAFAKFLKDEQARVRKVHERRRPGEVVSSSRPCRDAIRVRSRPGRT